MQAPAEPLPIDLALQGDGSHGAFTWGVLAGHRHYPYHYRAPPPHRPDAPRSIQRSTRSWIGEAVTDESEPVGDRLPW